MKAKTYAFIKAALYCGFISAAVTIVAGYFAATVWQAALIAFNLVPTFLAGMSIGLACKVEQSTEIK